MVDTIRAGVLGGCAALALAGAARAQDHPLFLPTRDVAVTYDLGGGQSTHLYYSARLGKLRIDTPNGAGYTVLDRPGHQRLMVMTDRQAYVAMPTQPGMDDGFILNNRATYNQGGQSRVAGVACTDWSVSSPQMSGQACVTADGVLLSGQGRPTGDQQGGDQQGGNQQGGPPQETSLTATSVVYAPQADRLFTPPAGFRKVDPSQMQGPGPSGQGQ